MCFAAKWHGEKKVEFRSDFHDGHEAMILRARELYDEADAIITYNGKGFDNKHLRREWLMAGIGPDAGPADIDLWTVVARNFKFASNKLDHVCQQLGLGSKVKHSGFELWPACIAGDPQAWKQFQKYCCHDVVLTDALYPVLRPFIKSHPHRGLFGGPRAGCPRCESMHVIGRGYRVTTTGRYARLQCIDCRGYFTGTHRVEAVHHKAA